MTARQHTQEEAHSEGRIMGDGEGGRVRGETQASPLMAVDPCTEQGSHTDQQRGHVSLVDPHTRCPAMLPMGIMGRANQLTQIPTMKTLACASRSQSSDH